MEYFDVVDHDDKPTGKLTTKKHAHDKGHLHRVAAVLVFRPNGNMFVQRHKEWNRRMDHAVGGHVAAGESYFDAAQREMQEEIGLEADLGKIGVVGYKAEHYLEHDPEVQHIYGVFQAIAPGNWVFEPNDEVDDLIEMKVNEIVALMNQQPDKFLNGFLTTMAAYLKSINSEKQIIAYGKNWGEL